MGNADNKMFPLWILTFRDNTNTHIHKYTHKYGRDGLGYAVLLRSYMLFCFSAGTSQMSFEEASDTVLLKYLNNAKYRDKPVTKAQEAVSYH